MKKTSNFKQVEQWGLDHHLNAKQTATIMGNIEDESTGITSQHGNSNYMQYMHGDLHAKNMYDYLDKFTEKMPAMKKFTRDFKDRSLSDDKSFFQHSVEVGKYGQRRSQLTDQFLPQVEKDFKAQVKTVHRDHDHNKVHHEQASMQTVSQSKTMNQRGRSMTPTLKKYDQDVTVLIKTAEKILNQQTQVQVPQNQDSNELQQ